MRKIIICIVTIIATSYLFAQNNVDEVLNSIEQNNTTLKSLRESVDAQKLENRTGIFLDDPEIGFNYLWGTPSSVGNRYDISVKQNLDFSTIFGVKNKVAKQKNELVEWQYKIDRMNILLEAKLYYLDFIYYNSLLRELYIRKQNAQMIADVQKERLDRGDGNILEYNNVQLNLLTLNGEILNVEIERNAIVSQLTRLNGSKELALNNNDFEFTSVNMPICFDDWYAMAEAKSPVLYYVKQELELSKKQISLSKAMGLPTLSAGYMSENSVGQRYNGITVGLTVPLWSNINKIKQAKAYFKATESRQLDAKQQFFNQVKIKYNRTLGLKKAADIYRTALENVNNSSLLKKALDAGEISILNYIIEIELYYNVVNQALQTERDFQKAFAELSSFDL